MELSNTQKKETDGTYYMTVRLSREELEQVDGLRQQYKAATHAKLSRHATVKLMIEQGYLEVIKTVIEPMKAITAKLSTQTPL